MRAVEGSPAVIRHPVCPRCTARHNPFFRCPLQTPLQPWVHYPWIVVPTRREMPSPDTLEEK